MYGGAPGAVALQSPLIVVPLTSTFRQVAPVGSLYLKPFVPGGLPSADQPADARAIVSLMAPDVNVIDPPSVTGLSLFGSGSANVPLETNFVLPPGLLMYTRTGTGISAATAREPTSTLPLKVANPTANTSARP
jgi:hypothetical protein